MVLCLQVHPEHLRHNWWGSVRGPGLAVQQHCKQGILSIYHMYLAKFYATKSTSCLESLTLTWFISSFGCICRLERAWLWISTANWLGAPDVSSWKLRTESPLQPVRCLLPARYIFCLEYVMMSLLNVCSTLYSTVGCSLNLFILHKNWSSNIMLLWKAIVFIRSTLPD